MSTQTITTYLCDPCINAGVERTAEHSHEIAIDAYRVRVDLCAEHNRTVMGALAALIGQRGTGQHICAWCGYIAASPKALAAHVRFAGDHAGARKAG